MSIATLCAVRRKPLALPYPAPQPAVVQLTTPPFSPVRNKPMVPSAPAGVALVLALLAPKRRRRTTDLGEHRQDGGTLGMLRIGLVEDRPECRLTNFWEKSVLFAHCRIFINRESLRQTRGGSGRVCYPPSTCNDAIGIFCMPRSASVDRCRLLKLVLMSFAIFLAPMTAAADTILDSNEAPVEVSDNHSVDDGSDSDSPHKERGEAGHHCAGCHIHAVGSCRLHTPITRSHMARRFPMAASAHALHRADGLFRPPRS